MVIQNKCVPDGTLYGMARQYDFTYTHSRKGNSTREVGYAILMKQTR